MKLCCQGLRPPGALTLGAGGQLVSATMSSPMMPRMTVASTSPYATLMAPTGITTTTAQSVSSYQQAAVLAALQLQQQSLFSELALRLLCLTLSPWTILVVLQLQFSDSF